MRNPITPDIYLIGTEGVFKGIVYMGNGFGELQGRDLP